MKLGEIDIQCVTRAVSIYVDLAYGGGHAPRRMPDLSVPASASAEQVLGLFQRECVESECGAGKRVRYALRLGNRNYPFMKLVLLEHMVADEFFFGVDTHDEMDIKPDYPDYEAWMSGKRFNRGLKQRIDAQFGLEGLETAATLLEQLQRRDRVVGDATGRILVVDDEVDLAESVECLLQSRGYQVELASDGRIALDKIQVSQPDLVVLDYEMPEIDGLEVLATLREDATTAKIPVLFTTASQISLNDAAKADGFLAKPFPESLLYEMVERLIDRRHGNPE